MTDSNQQNVPYPQCKNTHSFDHWADDVKHDPNFWQLHWLDRMRERIAIALAPWACHDDLVEWYRRGRP